MKAVDESIVEQASLEWLDGLGYATVHEDSLSPRPEDDPPRGRYSDVVLKPPFAMQWFGSTSA
jgi:hypothetical protein